jgi:hypothetical protein
MAGGRWPSRSSLALPPSRKTRAAPQAVAPSRLTGARERGVSSGKPVTIPTLARIDPARPLRTARLDVAVARSLIARQPERRADKTACRNADQNRTRNRS